MSDLNHFEVVSKQTRSALQRQASTVHRDLNAGISSLPELFGDNSFHGHLPHFHIRQTKVSFVDEELTRGPHLSSITKEGASTDSFKGRQLRHSLSMRSIEISKSAATLEQGGNEHGIVDEEAAIPEDSCRHSFVY